MVQGFGVDVLYYCNVVMIGKNIEIMGVLVGVDFIGYLFGGGFVFVVVEVSGGLVVIFNVVGFNLEIVV